jgi:MOSC domain-containing protein YiiM
MEAHGLTLAPGAFGENLIVEGIALAAIEVGARVRVGGAVLRVTQLGKACHTRCAIYETAGDCIMPRRGVFAEVVEPGAVVRGSVVERLDEAAPHEATEAAG